MGNSDYTLEGIEHLAKLIIPRLEAVGAGSGSYVHRANQLVATIKGWLRLSKDEQRIDQIVTCREYIRTAEMWLAKIAVGGHDE